jgi:hypothetical protein
MATTPESRFVRSIGKLLPSDIYSEGMANPYRGGTPDRYYEGCLNHLWVEYKYRPTVPATWRTRDHVTALQIKWIRRAQKNNVPVVVIAGFGKGGLVLTKDMYWEQLIRRADIENNLLTKQDIATFIITHCGTNEQRQVYPH